ncbi:hypothetical protein C8J57DRAFT_237498 [Mycena rebaudengoi]|nr:hypothetical protein C8J57DRAFT_237498 [Mycena rebaudengoi]
MTMSSKPPVTEESVGRLGRLSRLTNKPITLAIIWALVCVLNITMAVIFIYSVSRPNSLHKWWYYILIVMGMIGACSAAFSSLRYWKLHRAQAQALPLPSSYSFPAPGIPTR